MTSRTITDEITGARSVEVRCDICRRDAPPATEIIAAHGLVRLGWLCSGGTHVCGPCAQADETKRTGRVNFCRASMGDGECNWPGCPQLRDDEPAATGRHCPLDEGCPRCGQPVPECGC